MVSDWSGAALEYSFGLKKPVIFLDLPKKVNNPMIIFMIICKSYIKFNKIFKLTT